MCCQCLQLKKKKNNQKPHPVVSVDHYEPLGSSLEGSDEHLLHVENAKQE